MNTAELFGPIKTFVFDVDGVMTDGTMIATEEGHLLRTMNIKDGYALQLAIKKGYDIWVISGARSEGVKIRLEMLGIRQLHIGVQSKKELLQKIAGETGVDCNNILFMGDDMPDYAAMQVCGLPCCPADAVPDILNISKYVSPYGGGKGCVRDVLEKVMKLNGDWDYPS